MTARFRELFEQRHARGRAFRREGRKVVATFYGLAPRELIHAAGMVPVQLVEDRDARYEARGGLLPYLCGMSRNLAGQIAAGVFDYVDGVLVATVCDTNRHLLDVWVHRQAFPRQWLVRTPAKDDAEAVAYFARELRRLGTELGEVSGQPITDDALRASIGLFNESRALFRRFQAVRAAGHVSAEEALYIFGAALTSPVEEHNALLRALLAAPPPPAPGPEPRLMLCALNLSMALDLIRMAEKYGASVVADDLAHNARYGSAEVPTDGDPFEALARGYLRRVPAPGMYPVEARANSIREAMEAAGAQGLIYLVQLYCDAYAFEYATLKSRFDRWQLPHLKLEAEATPGSIEQLNVRVQSFVESLL